MVNLFAHNSIAYESAIKMLATTGKAAIIHPTGTGKSFIAFKLCDDNADKRILWLSPSEYIFNTQIENLKTALNGYAPDNIKFCTYARLIYMSGNDIAQLKPDYIILDEFHRCGAEAWGKGVQTVLNAYPQAPVLGLSATNIRYLDNQRDMADELFDGNIASEMTLGEAIVRGILNPPKYVLSAYRYKESLDRYAYRAKHAKSTAVQNESEKYLDALRRALDKSDGLPQIFEKHIPDKNGKYIVFCAGVDHLKEMAEKSKEWFGGIDADAHIYCAYSSDPETSKAFADFKKDCTRHLKLLFCIDMLNEGVHIEDVNGVILLRPTVSPIIYKQQIGRALSASKTTDAVIFDIVMNIDNLYSIGSLQDEMKVVMTYYRECGLGKLIVNDKFEIVDEVRDCREIFEKLNSTLTASWDYMFEEAKKYYEKYGNLNAPRRYKTPQGYSLGSWLMIQRKVRSGEQAGYLTEDRIKKLDGIGMIWRGKKDLSWDRNFQAAKDFYAERGNLKVPASFTKNGINLGKWIANLRSYRKSGAQGKYLTMARVSELDKLGMIWDVKDALWERNYNAAKRYYQSHGNLDVAVKYVTPEGIKLGIWLGNIRNARKNAKNYKLTQEQIHSLNSIGMNWQTKAERMWEVGFAHALEYFLEQGNLNVPTAYVANDGYKLGNWISEQRRRAQKLGEERKSRLDNIGFVWTRENSWDKTYLLAKAFYEEHGHLRVPRDYQADGVWLNKWLNEQKQILLYNRGSRRLRDEQIALLEAIGVDRQLDKNNSRAQAWNALYEEAKVFYEQYGNLCVSKECGTAQGKALQVWLNRQRKAYREGKLDEEQIEKLQTLGMIWEFEDAWEVGFNHALEYREKYGDLLVKNGYVSSDGYNLGNWISNQRNKRKSKDGLGKLSEERINRLDSIGMIWDAGEYSWNCAYESALRFYKEHRHIKVPRGTVIDGIDLQSWVCEQRKKYRLGKLTRERMLKLATIEIITLPEIRIAGGRKGVTLRV